MFPCLNTVPCSLPIYLVPFLQTLLCSYCSLHTYNVSNIHTVFRTYILQYLLYMCSLLTYHFPYSHTMFLFTYQVPYLHIMLITYIVLYHVPCLSIMVLTNIVRETLPLLIRYQNIKLCPLFPVHFLSILYITYSMIQYMFREN